MKSKLQNYDNSKLKKIIDNQDKSQTDVLLIILEITKNMSIYNLQGNPKSKTFWKNIVQLDELKNIFSEFKNETLRKYWYIISGWENFNKVRFTRKEQKFNLKKNIKLLSLIKLIEDFLKNTEINNFENHILKMFKSEGKIGVCKKYFNKMNRYDKMGGSGLEGPIIAYDNLLLSAIPDNDMVVNIDKPKFNWDTFLYNNIFFFGDNDSISAISGSWYGAYLGLDECPMNKVKELEFYKDLNKLIHRF